VKASLGATVDFAVAEPLQAQMLTLDAIAGDLEISRQMLDLGDRFAALLRTGRELCSYGAELPKLTEKALVGAISAVFATRLRNGEVETLVEMKPELVELTLIPYLGREEAARVAGQE
jgi:hypothetical protein